MKSLDAKKEICVLVDQLPEEDLETVKKLIKFLIAEREETAILEPLEPEEELRPEFVARLRQAEEEIKRGEVVSHEDVRKEIFGA